MFNDLECLWYRLVFLKWFMLIVVDLFWKFMEFFFGGGIGGCDIDLLINLLNVFLKFEDLINIGCVCMGGDLWWDGYVLFFFLLFGNVLKKWRWLRFFEKCLFGVGGRGLFWNMLDIFFVWEFRVKDFIFFLILFGEGDLLIIGFKELFLLKFWLDNRIVGIVWLFLVLFLKRLFVK